MSTALLPYRSRAVFSFTLNNSEHPPMRRACGIITPMTPPFDQLLKFTQLLHRYRTIERRILIKDSDQWENDVEHSYTLAMLAWYIVSTYKLDMDLDKIFQYALAHDVVEVYAGDTYLFENDTSVTESKEKREADSAARIQKEFPEFEELHQTIASYEKREDKESRFIYALDKVEAMLSNYIDIGRTWRKEGVTLEQIISIKSPKVAVDKTVEAIFNELVEKLKGEHDELFLVG